MIKTKDDEHEARPSKHKKHTDITVNPRITDQQKAAQVFSQQVRSKSSLHDGGGPPFFEGRQLR